MTRAIEKYSKKQLNVVKLSKKDRIQQERIKEEIIKEERMQDVLLLLQHLVEREEVTVKLILDCLYDVASVNLVNKKFQTRPVNRFMKFVLSRSKPVFKIVALKWFKKNCPALITNWLQSKVDL